MNRTDRLYAIVEELRAASPRPLSVPRLARRFEVSTRTVERDLLALQETGVPIYAEAGRTGGYVLDKRMSLPPVNFTPQEATAMAVALATSPRGPFADSAGTALRKVLAAMPPTAAATTQDVVERVQLVLRADEPDGVPRQIQDAIVTGHVLRMSYVDRDGVLSDRVVEPTAFVNAQDRWYLLAWCRLREGGRVFRMDRITRVVDTGERMPFRSIDELGKDAPGTLRSVLQIALETPT